MTVRGMRPRLASLHDVRRWSVVAAVACVFGAQLSIAASAVAATSKASPFDGVWRLSGAPVVTLRTAAGAAPPLRAEAAATYATRQQQRARNDLTYDAGAQCKPIGHPRLLWEQGLPFDIQVTPKRILFGHTWNRLHRLVDVTAAAPAVPGPTYMGTATARWDHGALVVRSAGYNDATLLDAAGLPHSDALALTERWTLAKGAQQLTLRLHVEDAKTFSQPWDTVLRFERVPDGRIREDVCELRQGLYRETAVNSPMNPIR